MELRFQELSEEVFGGANFECKNFLQSLEMYHRYQNLGKEAYLVGVTKGPRTPESAEKSQNLRKSSTLMGSEFLACALIVARPWHFGKKIFRIAGGPMLDYDTSFTSEILAFLTANLHDFVAKKGGIVLEISPNIISQPRNIENQVVPGRDHLGIKRELLELGYKYLGEYEQAKWLFTLDLRGKTEQEIWDSLRVTHRRMLRKADREGVKIREMTKDELPLFKEVLAETGARQGFVDPSLDYYRSMKKAFGDKVKFMIAERETEEDKRKKDKGYKPQPLAVAMYVIDGNEMIYLYGGANRAGQKYAGSYQMQWQMIKQAIAEKIPRYNFYGTKPIPGNGVYQFKQGFRGTIEELLGTFALPVGWLGELYVARLKEREIGELR